MYIRKFRSQDLQNILALFQGTVLKVNRKDYTSKQVETWASSAHAVEEWEPRLNQQLTWVAEQDSFLIGFGSMTKDGHLDLLFTQKDFQNQGVASTLLQHMEEEASEYGITMISTEASITAKDFFAARGYEEIEKKNVIIKDTEFTNYVMKKNVNN
ncbi:GNAT family N-acetyltransferase [Thalassobacillus sp. CUG 92003]|uniref:GNAT family N-acetyltransferase n=1 Tax=Thalassobacillus sp. CUG 92003 TaxID=2736641 RepID=UPI0015E70E56|nr:GNAT family N-acetyltransferase [Thalassobacillus sp. CUG 92003]